MASDFLTFAGSAGANVLSQADYVALMATERANGFSSGIARSEQLNKVWRQGSLISAMIGQFISDYSGNDAIDDGTTVNLLTNFLLALKSYNTTGALFSFGAASSYIKLPDDLGGAIFQWGSTVTNGAGVATVNLPYVYPNAIRLALTNDLENVAAAVCYGGVTLNSTSQITLTYAQNGVAANPNNVVWFTAGN